MKIFRRILLVILIFMILFLAIGFFLPSKLHIEKKLFIKSTADQVFSQVNDLKNWEKWSPWFISDSSVKIQFSDKTVGAGSSFSYQSQKYGSGKISIVNSYPLDSIIFEMEFVDRGQALGKFIFTKIDTGIIVSWIMESKLGYNPVSRWFNLIMKNAVGSDFDEGLSNLNTLMEKISIEFYQIEETTVPSRSLISIRDTCSVKDISLSLGQIYSLLTSFLQENKLSMTGAPICLYHAFTDSTFDMEPAFVVDKTVESRYPVSSMQLPECKAIKAVFFGPYKKTTEAWNALEKYLQVKQLVPSGSPWEEYITDPMAEKDTSKWQTNIYYPVK